jgi:putative membrane protein
MPEWPGGPPHSGSARSRPGHEIDEEVIEMIGHGYGLMGGFGFLWMIVFWIVIVAAVAFAVKLLIDATRSSRDRRQPPTDSAMEVLKRRYAAGEITKAQYEQVKKDLQHTP